MTAGFSAELSPRLGKSLPCRKAASAHHRRRRVKIREVVHARARYAVLPPITSRGGSAASSGRRPIQSPRRLTCACSRWPPAFLKELQSDASQLLGRGVDERVRNRRDLDETALRQAAGHLHRPRQSADGGRPWPAAGPITIAILPRVRSAIGDLLAIQVPFGAVGRTTAYDAGSSKQSP